MSTDHNFWRERRAEAHSNRGPSALPLGQTGSQMCAVRWCRASCPRMAMTKASRVLWTGPTLRGLAFRHPPSPPPPPPPPHTPKGGCRKPVLREEQLLEKNDSIASDSRNWPPDSTQCLLGPRTPSHSVSGLRHGGRQSDIASHNAVSISTSFRERFFSFLQSSLRFRTFLLRVWQSATDTLTPGFCDWCYVSNGWSLW